ncbi:hypothetical protein GPECTOR_16g658 [Gonium pectorale]|uniref:RAVE complex protein Rav1 C-terminal domain-containing protein n=1 Tax=Gonium pectorale TaxID=33097 RepID=A0A150GKY5_GONPE|nr:hypothetical protein GPECTOR_16g658 [Gonium pectorale]|eukprot:KXZ50483.1 hypothetical protein GPECTOR_16g658 [Gonium pectorale]
MTLGADWVIRIYVEVVMQNMLPPELAASAPGLSMSQFCLTLVIEPPGLNLTPQSRPGMRVCWARPLGTGGGAGAGATADGGSGSGAGGSVDGTDADGEQAGGGGAAVEFGSRLQWVVASVGVAAAEEGDAPHHEPVGGGGHGSLPMDEAVCVWAVDGLAAVVLSGMTRGAVSSGKTAASPKAVLWGTEQRSVSWLQPAKLLPPSPSTLRPEDFAISAYVSYPGGMPLLAAADSCVGMQGVYAEVRSYQVSPTATTTPGPAGQTATYLRVASLARQSMTGSPETLSTMLVHPAADVALLRDRTGGVALWALSPLCELPIGVAPAAASASRVLLASVGQLAAVSWLSYYNRPAATAGFDGMVAYLACIHSGRLLVYAVLLPAATVSAWADGGAAVVATAAGWGALFLAEVLRADLPPGVGAVRALHTVAFEGDLAGGGGGGGGTGGGDGDGDELATPAAVGAATLVALADCAAPDAGVSGASGHRSGCGSGVARPQEEPSRQQVWVTWRLQVQPADADTGISSVEVLSDCVDDISDCLRSAMVTHESAEAHRDTAHSPATISCSCTSLASPMDFDAETEAGCDLTGGGAGGTGVVMAVALDGVSGYAAAATTCGDGDIEEALFIWRLSDAQETSDGGAAAAGEDLDDGLGASYVLEAVVPVNDTVSALSWLAAAGLSACLAVGYASGRVGLLAKDRSGGWEELASYSGAAAVAAFGSARGGAVAMAAGNHLLCFSNALDCSDPLQRPQPTLAAVAADFAGPLPPYHPGPLLALIAKGRLGAACRVLRRLLEWLREGCREGKGHAAGGEKEHELKEGSTDGGAVTTAAPRAPLVIDLAQLLSDGLLSSRGFAAFQQVMSAPVWTEPPRLAAQPPAAAAAAPAAAGSGAGAGLGHPLRLVAAGTAAPDDPSAPLRPLFPGAGTGAKAAASGGAPAAGGAQPAALGPSTASQVQGLESGKVDLSAFGDFGGLAGVAGPSAVAEPRLGPPTARPSALESGALDLSSFGGFGGDFGGGFGGFAPEPHRPPSPPPQSAPPQPGPAGAAAALHTGMLDMSAFGDFGAVAPPMPAPPPPQPPAAQPPVRSSAVESGVVDMSAFAGFGGYGGHAVQPALAQPQPQRPGPALGLSGLESGMVDISSLLFTPGTLSPHTSHAIASPGFGPGFVPGLGTAPTGGSTVPDADPWVVFPRVPDPTTPADTSLPELLLTGDEVADLHRLLGQDPPHREPAPAASSWGAGLGAGSYGTGGLYGGARGDDPRDGAAVADAVAALTALGLTPEDGCDVCRLAVALSRRAVGDGGGGGMASSSSGSTAGGTTDVMVGLDFAARSFLVQARLAAAGAHAAAAAAESGPDDGAFAAAVSRLFRPVTVTRAPAASPQNLLSPTASSAALNASPPVGSSVGGRIAASGAASSSQAALGAGTRRQAVEGRRGGGGWMQHSSSGVSGPPSRSRSRSVLSVMSVLSFSSLPDALFAGRVSVDGRGAEDAAADASGWWQLVGMMEGLDMRSCLAALASGSQGQLLDAVLPAVPWVASADEEASAAPDGRHASAMGGGGGGGAGGGGGGSASSAPRPSLSWPLLRKVGAGFWLADPRVMREQAEALAKAHYARRKEPYDCALLYLALGRKALLISLFRQASNLKIAEFLLRDFSKEEPRRSAAKNAFALLGQHRYELASAFFILAGQHYDAVSVLVRERRDPQLALLVARLLDPAPGGPLARRVIDQELMPLAVASRDACAMATLEVLAGRPDRAVLQLLNAAAGGAAGPADVDAANDRGAGSGAASASAPHVKADAAALDYCLRIGVQYLSGRPVPASAARALRRLALHSSRALEAAGLSAAALEALLVTAALQPAAAPPAAGAAAQASPGGVLGLVQSQKLDPALERRYSRLLAACLSYSLEEAQRRQQQALDAADPEDSADPAAAAAAAATAGAGGSRGGPRDWRQQARDALARLAPALGPPVDEREVLRLLGRHVGALKRVRFQPLVPPELLMARPRLPSAHSRSAAAAMAAVASSGHLNQSHHQHHHHYHHSHYHQGRVSQPPPQRRPQSAGGAPAAAGGPHRLSGGGAAAGPPPGHALSPESSYGSFVVGGGPGNLSPPLTSFASPEGSARTSFTSYHGAAAGGGRHAMPHGALPLPPVQHPAPTRHQAQTPPASPHSYSSGASGGGPEGARRPEGTAAPSGWGVFEAPWDVLAVEGDRCRSLAVMRDRSVVGDDGQLPFAVATAKSGLVGGLLGPPALAPQARAAAGPSSLFLGLMQSVLHHVRWTPDPWAMMSSEPTDEWQNGAAGGGAAVATGSAAGSSSAAVGPPAGGGRGGSQHAGGGGGAAGPGSCASTATVALASHPERDWYLSGSTGLLTYQWRFGEAAAHTVYVPCPEPHPGAANVASAAAARARAGGASAASVAAASAAALDLHAPHWGHAAALAYSTPAGGRFVGIGEGGLVALWRADGLGPGGLGYSDWMHHCVGKRGRSVAFVGDSSSQVLVAGQGDRGGLVGWWDSLAPPPAACVAEIRGRRAVPTSLLLMRPDAGGVLVFGDESGELVATDLRMMAAREYIWTIPRAHASAVTAMAQWGPGAAGVLTLPQPAAAAAAAAASSPGARHSAAPSAALMSNLLVSGGKDGSLALVDISSGKVVSYLERAHCATKTGLPGLLAAAAASAGGGGRPVDRTIVRRSRPAGAGGAAVGALACVPDGGFLSCGSDGVVRYHPLAPQLLDLRSR